MPYPQLDALSHPAPWHATSDNAWALGIDGTLYRLWTEKGASGALVWKVQDTPDRVWTLGAVEPHETTERVVERIREAVANRPRLVP